VPYGRATAIESEPVTLWYVAVTVVLPAATPVTTPAADTVATAASPDCHVALLVMSCVVPLLIVAVAVNCAVVPTVGAAPVTAMEATVDDDVGELEHAAANTATRNAIPIEASRPFMMVSFQTCAGAEPTLQPECHSIAARS
jgi:hypothetical protein